MVINVDFSSMEEIRAVFGSFDENIQILRDRLGVDIRQSASGAVISGEGKNAKAASDALNYLKALYKKNDHITVVDVNAAVDIGSDGDLESAIDMLDDVVAVTSKGKRIKCRTYGQKKYINTIRNKTVTICIGPAGTGKTYLAMAMAVVALKNKQVSRIILTRPAVEAGEKLGFLPGDLQNKVDPYLRPLYDALYDFMGADAYSRLSESGAIEVAPLAYMRGRTLNDSFIILDEAQNCTREQLKMFLTRFGEDSKVVITGDITQIDLPKERSSGLSASVRILKSIDDVGIIYLTGKDVVRHSLVREIIKAFEGYERSKAKTEQEAEGNEVKE